MKRDNGTKNSDRHTEEAHQILGEGVNEGRKTARTGLLSDLPPSNPSIPLCFLVSFPSPRLARWDPR